MLRVTLFTVQPTAADDQDDLVEETSLQGEVFEDIDFVSLVNGGTYGPPALIAPARGEAPVAKVGEAVLYVNTSSPYLVAFQAERVRDR